MFAVYDICEDRWVGFVTETFCDGPSNSDIRLRRWSKHTENVTLKAPWLKIVSVHIRCAILDAVAAVQRSASVFGARCPR